MKPSRNDPCPCGSGRKYKACHLQADQLAAALEQMVGADPGEFDRAVKTAAQSAPVWAADVAPLPTLIRETGEAGALTMVEAAGFIVGGEVLGRRPVGIQARARAVAAAVMSAGRAAGVLPERVRVREEALAAALRPELAPRGIAVEAGAVPELDTALHDSVRAQVGGLGNVAILWKWSETEATAGELAALHAAAAELYAAAPWVHISAEEPALVQLSGEATPFAVGILGSGGQLRGVSIYTDPAEMEALLDLTEEDVDDEFFSGLRSEAITLSFRAGSDVDREMRREVARARWPLAGGHAYPYLAGVAIPGLRVTDRHVRLATTVCRLITQLVRARPDELPWLDTVTGAQVVRVLRPHRDDSDDEDLLAWPPLTRAHPVGPRGPNAQPRASLPVADAYSRTRLEQPARDERFAEWLSARRLSRAARDRLLRTAALWTDHLFNSGVPAEAVTEFTLRRFLYHHLPRMARRPSRPVAEHLTRSLRTLFEFHEREEGIWYPWADEVLDELDDLQAASGLDVRDLLEEMRPALRMDMYERGLLFAPSVPGTQRGWFSGGTPLLATAEAELMRLWLLWHDEVVESGVTEPSALRDILVGRQREWETAPNPLLGGSTPVQAIRAAEDEA